MATSAAPVIETTSRRRVVPAKELEIEQKAKQPDFWEYLEGLTHEDWKSHILYIYRMEPKISNLTDEPSYEEKVVEQIEVEPGRFAAIVDRPSLEGAVAAKYGGTSYRFIMKKNTEWICQAKCANGYPPKFPNKQGMYVNPNAANQAGQSSDSVAVRAIDAVSGKESAGITIAIEALRAAKDALVAKPAGDGQGGSLTDRILTVAVERLLVPPAPPPTNPLIDRLLTAAIDRMLAPPVAPVAPGTNGSNPLVDKILNAAVERMLNPVPMSGEKTNIGVELVRALPAMISQGRDAVESWSVGMQAQERTAAIMSGRAPNPPATQPASSPPQRAETQPPSQPSAAPPAAPGVEPSVMPSAIGEPPIDWLEVKILEILMEPSYSVDEAVDETLSFLYRAAPSMPGRLLAAGEEGLTHLFRTRPILAHVPMNARLVEFIKKFVIETEAAEAARKPAPKVETIRNVPPAEPPPASA